MTKEFNAERFTACKKLVGLGAPAIVAKHVMAGGVARPEVEHLALVSSKAELEQQAAGLKAGVNSWVVDTGSGHNLVPRDDLTENEKANMTVSDEALRLSTANGIIEARDITNTIVSELGTHVIARVLDKTPRVLSVQQLVEQEGASFSWTPAEGAVLVLRGVKHRLPIKQGVPLLALPSVMTPQSTSAVGVLAASLETGGTASQPPSKCCLGSRAGVM
jgi:hypothetical protein